MKLLETFVCNSLYEHVLLLLLGKELAMDRLCGRLMFKFFKRLSKYSPKDSPFYFPIDSVGEFQFFHVLISTWYGQSG